MADDMRMSETAKAAAEASAAEDVSAIPQDELNRMTDALIAAFKSVHIRVIVVHGEACACGRCNT